MTIVYVITSGSYSDYGIDSIFLDEEKAKKYIASEQLQGHTINPEPLACETSDDEILPTLTKYYRAYVHIRFVSEFPSGTGFKYYGFDEIKEQEPIYAASDSLRTKDNWETVRQQLTSPGFYSYTINGISNRSQKVAKKIVQDRMAETIQIVENAGFIPARD